MDYAPVNLVKALQEGMPSAREKLWQILRNPLERMMIRWVEEQNLPYEAAHLTLHALHSAEIYLRTRQPIEFAEMSWTIFRAALLIHEAKMILASTTSSQDMAVPEISLPSSPNYLTRTLVRPSEKIGSVWFTGDWVGGHLAEDGALWFLIADVTGHGLPASLLARHLPAVWELALQQISEIESSPARLILDLHHLLVECLPEGVYVEATAVCCSASGYVKVAPAGGTRLVTLLAGKAERHALRGSWLGLFTPRLDDEHGWQLEPGDELLLGSDGLFDHLPRQALEVETFPARNGEDSILFQQVDNLLSCSLQEKPQQDDISMVVVRRLATK